jgi:uncharacterized protein YacL
MGESPMQEGLGRSRFRVALATAVVLGTLLGAGVGMVATAVGIRALNVERGSFMAWALFVVLEVVFATIGARVALGHTDQLRAATRANRSVDDGGVEASSR